MLPPSMIIDRALGWSVTPLGSRRGVLEPRGRRLHDQQGPAAAAAVGGGYYSGNPIDDEVLLVCGSGAMIETSTTTGPDLILGLIRELATS
ncbi:MAG: hypothetical protein ACLPKB_16525 [Xanthobacteraceae bacterium]